MPTKHLLIKGKVQGVFYRATAKKMAESFAITGWVKNTSEGHVEAMVSGTEKALADFIAWCKKGPDNAIVTSVDATDEKDTAFKTFDIIR